MTSADLRDPLGSDTSPEEEEATTTPSSPRRAVTISPEESLVRQRDEALRFLTAGYPTAGAAEVLLLRLAAADATSVSHLQAAELALTGVIHDILVHDPAKIAPMARVLRDINSVTTAIRNRVQSSLTAASTIMAQNRLARLHRQGTDG